MPLLSVIVPCRTEISTIDRFLRSLEGQICQCFSIEAVIADGGSSDGTHERLEQFARQHAWVQIIDNPGRIASTGLNAAIRHSRGCVIARMDAHSEYAPNYLAECVQALERTGAASVGGPVLITAESAWQRAFALAVQSRVFAGGSTVYDTSLEGPVDSVPYGCWPREVLETAGLFDERMERNQDDELSLRIKQAGGVIWQSPRIRSFYSPRSSPVGLARQFFGYGFWKVYTMRKHSAVVRARHVAPALALGLTGILAVASRSSSVAQRLLATAAAVYAVTLAIVVRRIKIPFWAIFPIAHASYAAGTLTALFTTKLRP